MKKYLTLALALILFISAAVWAGPFVGFNLTLPQTATLTMGIKTDDLRLALVFGDILTPTPDISFSGTYTADFNWWDSTLTLNINDIDLFTNYPIPTITGLGLGIKGTIHVGTLVSALAGDSQGSLAAKVFDLYGGVYFDYVSAVNTLVPKFNIGFYWEY